ncbi:Sugar kinase of the NBD/HSP70 family, may contain an N-terminal HTH domain [Xaviernesmea oryzae]|uniref:Sugar kinase of the NBD/HSP70 family, may contain an N-terminal HTH domain n=1 Tax=Xaviernesmea oryzae TaxID=464029 RepID=A0A1X7EQ30_9HYPH|nr:ROK family protein [Xaviernesmea oryzae]SMF37780.1 Sugar kinase of the NBD/HSP70 family, may contain an N-terminal HTH domain [Xaviernesmea oryzae]
MTIQTIGTHPVAIGKNPERSRDHNRRVVLDVVRRHGSLGRAHIAKLSQLTPQAVANIVDELVGEGLLMEMGRLRSGRGQPPIQFAVNPEGGATIGVEIAADHMVTVALDLSGRLRAKRITSLKDTTPRHILASFTSELSTVRKSVGSKLLGTGVVMPGPFEIDGMTSVGPTTLPGWAGIDAAQALSEACGHTVVVENDATAAAVGERLFGAGLAISNFCMIYFGVGIGLGIIQDGAPYRGAFGNAGEIGHVTVVPKGRPCPSCGQLGCLEGYASVYVLKEKLGRAGMPECEFADLERLHRAEHPVVEEWIDEAATYLGPMVAMLENILDPQTVILGGALPDAIMDDIIARMGNLPTSVASRRQRDLPRVLRGQTGQLTAALGAAALPLFDMVTPKLETSLAGLADIPA